MKIKAFFLVAALSIVAPSAFGSEGVIMKQIKEGISSRVVKDDSIATAQARFKFAMDKYRAGGRLRSANESPNENSEFTYVKINDQSQSKACAISLYDLTGLPTVGFDPRCQP